MKKNTNQNNPKGTNITLVVALIGLIGTVITAIFTSPVLIAWFQKETVNPSTTPDFGTTPTQFLVENMSSPEPETAFTWLNQPIKEVDFYSTGNARYSFSPDIGLDVTSTYSNDRVWINKTLPKNFSIVISFLQFEKECLMYTGFGDGQNDKNSFTWLLHESTAYFAKNTGGDDLSFVDKPINYISVNQISTYILERVDGHIILKDTNGEVIFRIKPVDEPEWLDINEVNTFWFYGGGSGGRVCTIRYTSLKVSEIKQ